MAMVREFGEELSRLLAESAESVSTTMVSVKFQEGSFWVILKILLKETYEWMRQAGASALKWMRDNKEKIDFWLRTINNLLSILTNTLKIIIGWLGGGGSLPGTA
jgi:hypothetical protein